MAAETGTTDFTDDTDYRSGGQDLFSGRIFATLALTNLSASGHL